jgi:hypothetical protein
LKELRAAFTQADGYSHVNRFVDMHDLGDALVHASFADPVMEMEMITLEYATVDAVARDLKAIGAHNSLPGRPRGLAGRARWARVVAGYETWRRDGVLPDIVRGHLRPRVEGGAAPDRGRAPGDRLPAERGMNRGVFVTGTRHGRRQDGGVVRPCCTRSPPHGIAAMPMKPIAAGAEGSGANADTLALLAAAGHDRSLAPDVTPILLREAIAPHIAAAHEGRTIELAPVLDAYERLRARGDFMVVEGRGRVSACPWASASILWTWRKPSACRWSSS